MLEFFDANIMLIVLGIVVFCGVTGSLGQDYEVPAATVEVFRPKGFRISIPGNKKNKKLTVVI